MGSIAIPDISVIIPLYNKGKYIARALDSVFAQTYQDFEVIVVDDGSTDEGPDIVRTYHDHRLRLIQQANSGPGAARNRGIEETSAPYLAFLDADDEWLPEFLAKSVHKLQANPDCDIAASAYFLGAERTNVVPIFQKRGITEGTWCLSSNISKKEFRHAIYIFHSSSTVCRREVIERYGGFYTKNHCNYGEDYYLWLQIMFNHKVYRILEPLFWFHGEASELGSGAKSTHSLEPILADPGPIFSKCPQVNRELLERWLAQYALATAHEFATCGEIARVLYLQKTFPLMKIWRWEYAKLRVKIAFPPLISLIRRFKKFCYTILTSGYSKKPE